MAGYLGLLVLGVALVLGMAGAERVTARLLGLPSFRWFEVEQAPGWWWKRALVRLVSALVPFALCASLFFVLLEAHGIAETTTAVTVLPESPAEQAGMRDGDKVLALAGTPIASFDELRTRVQAQAGPVTITLERAGQPLQLTVTPKRGRIGVSPLMASRKPQLGEALSIAARQPLRVLAEAAKAFLAPRTADLSGPVGIVSETSKAAQRGWKDVLWFVATLGAYVWPFVAAVHVFDVLTGWVFRTSFSQSHAVGHALRLARLRFSMYSALACWLAFVLAEIADRADVPGASILLAFAVPGAWAVWPLSWVSSRALWEKRSPLSVILPAILVPCVAPFLGFWMARRLGAANREVRP